MTPQAERTASFDSPPLSRADVIREALAAGEGVDPAELKPEYVRDKVALTEAERRVAK